MLSITDASSAARFGLNVARITNVNGDVVSPTVDSINSAISHFTASDVAGVRVSNPAGQEAGIYPLSQLVYAAINICQVDAPTAVDYQKLLNYAVHEGQVEGTARGMLPRGYVPISDAERSASEGVAASLGNLKSAKAGCSPAATPSTTPSYSGSTTPDVPNAPSPSASASAPTNGPTADHLNWTTSIAGIGFVAGVPMCAVGPLMVSRARRARGES